MTEQFQQQQQQQQQQAQEANSSTAPQSDSESCTNVFSSVEFGRFLSKEFPKTALGGGVGGTNPFLSKDNPLPSFEISSVFKSKDAFSRMFSSSDWEMKFDKPASPQSPSNKSDNSNNTKTFPSLASSVPQSTSVAPVGSPTKADLKSIMSSREWLPMNTLGTHVDVSINPQEIFSGSDSEAKSKESAPKTDWDNMFFSQMQLVPPSPPQAPAAAPASPAPEEPLPFAAQVASSSDIELAADVAVMQAEITKQAPASDATPKKKRKRKPRKKIVPEKKDYVEPKPTDVLLGRGGRSNHHPGNKRYREEVQNLQQWYLGIKDKDEKTDLSQCLVDYVHSYDGRFLEKDSQGWYEVPNIVARRKASQALREDSDPAKRAAKRARFLAKRAKMAEQPAHPTTAATSIQAV